MVYPTDRECSWAKVIDHLYRLTTNYAHIEEMAVEDAALPMKLRGPIIGIHIGPRVLVLSVLGDRE